jgi:hypothetical protein
MFPGRTVPGVAEEAVDSIEARVSGFREFLKFVTFYAIAFGFGSDQVGQRRYVCGVAGQAPAFEDRLVDLLACDWMEDLVVAGHAGLPGAG